VPVSGKGWEKGKEDSGTGYLPLHTACTHAGEAFRTHTGQKVLRGVGRTEHGRRHLPYGAKAFSIAMVPTTPCLEGRRLCGNLVALSTLHPLHPGHDIRVFVQGNLAALGKDSRTLEVTGMGYVRQRVASHQILPILQLVLQT
jgi:hypothetical protein